MAKLKIHLKPGERIFLNGAVVAVDRKVTLELLNDVAFLLQSHVLQAEEATTPLRQLYFIVQSMLMEPSTKELARGLFGKMHQELLVTFKNVDVLEGLVAVDACIQSDRAFDALKKLRRLFVLEAEILARSGACERPAAVA